ncbi:MAG TPA: triphosphoribosyl-dephospho-CoA synthase [Archaeoglobus profundus]|nr:triphosphoribosyl-dephospho-CoA synthase [Archaeoglobus profundus]HIP58141.1 triphosphoribosyl-dephospho-CoA synthase [Archaeoglobus profundus]
MNSGSLIHFKNAEDAATAGVLALLLEVAGTPKAGNVDREHDFPELKFEHFLASASAVYPVFLKCARGESSVGRLILEAIESSISWQRGGNVHFGSFMLLIPLVRCWWANDIGKAVIKELKETTVEDSLAILKAFKLSGARVMEVEEMSLTADDLEDKLRRNNINLYEWLNYSPKENIIATELINGYPISHEGKEVLLKFYSRHNDISMAVVYTYHYLLSNYLDPLIIAKYGIEVAEYVKEKAKIILREFEKRLDIDILRKFDYELLAKRINPGSIADLTASSIYLALREGLKF